MINIFLVSLSSLFCYTEVWVHVANYFPNHFFPLFSVFRYACCNVYCHILFLEVFSQLLLVLLLTFVLSYWFPPLQSTCFSNFSGYQVLKLKIGKLKAGVLFQGLLFQGPIACSVSWSSIKKDIMHDTSAVPGVGWCIWRPWYLRFIMSSTILTDPVYWPWYGMMHMKSLVSEVYHE